jgi:hypothetical protein
MRLALALVLSACAAPAAAPHTTTPPPLTVPSKSPPPPPPHPDYGELRPYHNYYRVLAVAPYAHHFRAFYTHLEAVESLYVAEPGGKPVLRGTGFGLLTHPPAQLPPIPPDVAPVVEAIRADVRARASTVATIVYDGAYREIELEEITIRPKGTRTLHLAVKADRELTKILGRVVRVDSGGDLSTASGLDAPPQWIDAMPGHEGRPQLWSMYGAPATFGAEAMSAFEQATLVTARRVIAGEPGPAVHELAVERDRARVPADLERRYTFAFIIDADGPHEGMAPSAKLLLAPERAFGGVEEATAEIDVPIGGGRIARFEARFALHGPPLPPGAAGELDVPLALDYVVTTDTGDPAFTGSARGVAHVISDGDRTYMTELATYVPFHSFGPAGIYQSFNVSLGAVAPRFEP